MDGYAVRAADLSSATDARPVKLSLLEDVQAGYPPTQAVSPGQTSRISTGALVPEGADAVVMREVVLTLEDGTVEFRHPIEPGTNIRFAGEHLRPGEEVIPAETVMGPAEIGMAAFLGVQHLYCFPRPRVAVLTTGSELVEAGTALGRGQIRDSNGISLASALKVLGAQIVRLGRAPDSPQALGKELRLAFEESDLVLTSGGISAGWHDLVREGIESLGGEFYFHKLRMRPGKPLAFGRCGRSAFFCLPGNPVSTLVTFEVFVAPALRKMMGLPPKVAQFRAILAEPIEKKAGFAVYYRGIVRRENGKAVVSLTGPQGSHMLRSLTQANVLIRTEESTERLSPGEEVWVQPYGPKGLTVWSEVD